MNEDAMLQLNGNQLLFSFPNIHREARLNINFQRTLRIPDDDKTYPLPPGLGSFPLFQIDEFRDRVPMKWREHGGVMLPVFQSEALWISFSGGYVADHATRYPMAVKVATGNRSALTGDLRTEELKAKDYCVIPQQPWLDGYVIDKNTIRQFVAAPLGMGFTAEEQITGKAEYGGLQIEVFPMKHEVFLRRFPKVQAQKTSSALRSAAFGSNNSAYACSATMGAAAPDMGLAPGGKMEQQIFEDPYSLEDWDLSQRVRCFVHLANSLVWRAITQREPPTAPRTAADYTAAGLPWFNYYSDASSLDGTDTLKGLKSVMELGFQKGFSILPENEPVTFKSDQVVALGQKGQVRDGNWT